MKMLYFKALGNKFMKAVEFLNAAKNEDFWDLILASFYKILGVGPFKIYNKSNAKCVF